MQSKFFWKNWASPYKQLYWGLVALAILSISWFGYNYFIGLESILGWDILAKTEQIDVLINTFKTGPFTLSTSAENNIFFQQFSGGMPDVNSTSYYIFLGVTVFSLLLLFTVITALPRFWYFAGTALFAFVLVNYKFELLLLFGSQEKWGLIIAMALFLPISFYFNSIKSEISFLKRLLTFMVITGLLALIIVLFAEVDTPFFYLATYGMINPFVISLLFIIIVAHEILAAFIYILTSTTTVTSKNTVTHFYLISTIYLINLVLVYLHETNVIDWDIIYVNVFLLLFISAILGIWGFGQREEQYKYIFRFFPLGAITIIALSIICFVTIGHFITTFNDPAIEVIRDFIIYGHLGYGIIFIIYITSNFLDTLKANKRVHKILYKPTAMPYFTFRFAGLIALTALILKSSWLVPVNQGVAAYYNGIGDLHYYNRELRLAETYYEEGAIFGFNNHKSHYMLGKLTFQRKNDTKSAVHFKAASTKNPSPQSYINLSNIYLDQSRFFDAIFVLYEGLDKMPGNGRLLNNLGIAYSKTTIIDTAAYYLNEAFKISETKPTASSNIVALLAKNDLNIPADSVLESFQIADDPISLNNSFALKNKAAEYFEKSFVPKDSVLSFLDASLLYNRAFNSLYTDDSVDISKLDRLASVSRNIAFRDNLKLAVALTLYDRKNINKAFRELNWQATTSNINAGKYFNLIGLWALEQEVAYVAVDYFKWAADRHSTDSKFYLSIALTESGDLEEAAAAWLELTQIGDKSAKEIAQNMLRILTTSAEDYNNYPDQQKYLYTRYMISHRDTVEFNVLLSGIRDNNYRGQAILDMSRKLWRKDRIDAAIDYYSMLSGLEITDPDLFERIQWYELRMLAAQGNIRGLSTKINQGIEFDQDHILEKYYFTALISEASADTAKAKEYYRYIDYENPFFEEATIAAANYLGIQDRFEGYNILLSAIEINPKSVKLLKAYILQAARVQLNNYAQHSLDDLKPLISETAYREFLKEYQALVEKVEEAEWDF